MREHSVWLIVSEIPSAKQWLLDLLKEESLSWALNDARSVASAHERKKASRRLTIFKAVPKAVERNDRNTNGHSFFRSLYSDWKWFHASKDLPSASRQDLGEASCLGNLTS